MQNFFNQNPDTHVTYTALPHDPSENPAPLPTAGEIPTWSSSDTTIATVQSVSPDGISAVISTTGKGGVVVISVSIPEFLSQFQITVPTPPPVVVADHFKFAQGPEVAN